MAVANNLFVENLKLFKRKKLIQGTLTKDVGVSAFLDKRGRETLISSLGKNNFPNNNVLEMEQVHGVKIACVKKEEKLSGNKLFPSVDGIVTNKRGVLLGVRHADCVPIFLFDPVREVIGLVHSGWRGTVGKIGLIALQKMVVEFGSRVEKVEVALGPAAQVCCYRKAKTSVFTQLPEWREFIAIKKGEVTVDLSGFIEEMFLVAGVRKEHIKNSRICTIHNREFHSWTRRRDQGEERGTGMSVLGLKGRKT